MKIPFEEIEQVLIEDSCSGFCLGCGEQMFGVEPDACEYECPSCGEYKVYGAQTILIMGEYE
jgi:predicted RNA-binding Zn-ribbon protein involved in translation (DUF1610 family)